MENQFLNQRRILWGILATGTFLLFYYCIPMSASHRFPLLTAITGAVITAFFIAMFLGDFRSMEELHEDETNEEEMNKKDNPGKSEGKKLAPFAVIPGIILIFVFIFGFTSRESAELKAKGIKTKGRIVNGESRSGRRGSRTYEVSVSYQTKEGNRIHTTESVNSNVFNDMYKDKEVELIYSPDHPEIIDLLADAKTIEEYTGIKARSIGMEDMKKIFRNYRSCSSDSLIQYLNTISYPWTLDTSRGVPIYVNTGRNEFMMFSPSKDLLKVGSSEYAFMEGMNKSFKNEGYKKSGIKDPESDKSITVYHNDEYIFNIDYSRGSNGEVFSTISMSAM